MKLYIVLDKNEEGYHKVTKSGHYRFSVVVAEGDVTKPVLTIQGFRADQSLQHILPPSTGTRFGAFNIASVSREWEGKILTWLSRKLHPDDPELIAAGLAPPQVEDDAHPH